MHSLTVSPPTYPCGLKPEQYYQLLDLGWEWSKDTKSFDVSITLDDFSGIGFNAFWNKEKKNFELRCGEFDTRGRGHEFEPQDVGFPVLLMCLLPYLARQIDLCATCEILVD